MTPPVRLLAAAAVTALAVCTATAEEPSDAAPAWKLPADVLDLLRREMREISAGMQRVAPAIATGAWKTVADTGAHIQSSYVMEQALTPEQRKALQALPEGFKRLDREFHLQAEALQQAAEREDAELAAFRYYKLVDTCVACHTAYASHRFPALRPPTHEPGH